MSKLHPSPKRLYEVQTLSIASLGKYANLENPGCKSGTPYTCPIIPDSTNAD